MSTSARFDAYQLQPLGTLVKKKKKTSQGFTSGERRGYATFPLKEIRRLGYISLQNGVGRMGCVCILLKPEASSILPFLDAKRSITLEEHNEAISEVGNRRNSTRYNVESDGKFQRTTPCVKGHNLEDIILNK